MSPLFHRRSEEEKAAAQAAAQARREDAERSDERTAASLVQIEQGHIPVAAAERLVQFAQVGAGPTAFSSDLAVSEWSALARLGATPITQVMGSSIYHVGWQQTYFNVPTEVQVLSDAYNESRRLALGRLLEEAQACRADAVVGLRIDQGAHDWAAGAVEFIAVGTAVRLPEELRNPGGQALLSDLSGQEFVLLCNAGIRPVGIAAHTSVHYVPASIQTQQAQSAFGASWVNQELVDFSQGVYEAREKAMSFVAAQVQALGGDGVIGVELEQHGRTHSVRRGMYESHDLEVTFHVMGTVVREDATIASQPAPPPALQILSLR
ncbi:MAG TPA: heavy metal-binding domain-containing protein [Solirubrobacteraceae bacterium]|nr:heavy metal-binding domain-containing protein [Solirubrobacteraceae bacterium]